jgi:ABC-type multidrug transport system ATPase subunit
LKVLSGHLSPTKGEIRFSTTLPLGNTTPGARVERRKIERLESESVYRYVSYAAPYIELIEEFTFEEALRFHADLKPLLPGMTPARMMDVLALPRAKAKEIRFFSSGMKQRLKRALAVCSDTPLLLLDEPATNLDLQGIEWYKNLIAEYAANRTVVIASNDPHDAEFCEAHLNILDYK